MWPLFLLLWLVTSARSEVGRAKTKQMGLRDFNLPVRQYLMEVQPTKQGPVVFPNDGPPSPRPPLVVTSRPLAESIADSDLNPEPPKPAQVQKPGVPRSALRNPDYEYLDEQTLALLNLVEHKPSYLQPSPTPLIIVNDDKRPVYSKTPVEAPTARSDVNLASATATQNSDTQNPSKQRSNPSANSVAEQSRLNQVQYKPSYLQASPSPLILVNAVTGRPVGYSRGSDDYDLENNRILSPGANRLNDYEVHQPQYPELYHLNRVADHDDLTQNSDYAFSYKVRDQKTGDDFSHRQQSSGSATNGEYRVRLPDGRMQIVSYTADENGYKADVKYDDDKTVSNSVNNENRYIKSSHDYKQEVDKVPNYVYDIGSNQNYDYSNNHLIRYDNYKNDGFYKEAAPVKQENQYDVKDYENMDHEDYSLEYNGKLSHYQPHKSKFNDIATSKIGSHNRIVVYKNDIEEKANLKPSIGELRNLFLHRKPLPDYLNYDRIPVEINGHSTTPRPETYETSSEHVVIIGKPNLYTNIRSTLATPVTTPTPVYQRFSTPSFLPATSPTFRKNIDYSGEKPVFSSSFLDRINKYIHY